MVQDGGVAGTVWNLVILAVVGVVAIRAWGSARGLIIFAVGVVGFNLATTFAWPSVGAGNSAATFTLTAACGIVLLVLRDAHGCAMLGGLVIGALAGVVSLPGIVSAPAARARRVAAR